MSKTPKAKISTSPSKSPVERSGKPVSDKSVDKCQLEAKNRNGKAGQKLNAAQTQEAAKARRAIFIEAYITNGGNATQAAIVAGYSAKTARSQGQRLLTNVDIKAGIAARAEQAAKKYQLTTDLVVKSIVQELTFDPANLYQAGGQLKDITELDEDTRMALASVEFEQLGSKDAPVFVRKFKWAQRHGAREQAMKHLGMFLKDNEQQPSPTFILMEQITSNPNSRIKLK